MSRRLFRLTLLLLAAVLAATRPCAAAGQPVLMQSELRQPEKIWVGQRLDLTVTLLTTGTFAGVPRFDLPKDAGLAIVADDAHPLLGTKTIDGVAYISKQYTLSLFPLRAGTLALPAFPVEFGYQGDGGQVVDTTLSTTAAQITVLAVPGTDPKLPLVTATDLSVDDRWTPPPGKAAVGDAFTRTITLRATGLPGMALPPLQMPTIDGLALYAEQPQVGTDTARGDFIGKRVETFSLICQQVGTYTLPELRIQWWNPIGATLREVNLRPVTFQVAANPGLGAKAAAGAAGAPSPWRWAVGALLLGGAAAGLIRLLRKRRHRPAPAHRETEKALFKQFQRAAAANTAEATMRTLTRWFDAAGRPNGCDSLWEFVATCGDPILRNQFSALEASLYGKEPAIWSGKILSRQCAVARKKYRRHPRRILNRQTLGPLNPK